MSNKAESRLAARSIRRELLPSIDRNAESRSLASHAPDLLALAQEHGVVGEVGPGAENGAMRILSFSSLAHEPEMGPLNAALEEGGAQVLIPRLLPDRDLDWTRWSASPAHASNGSAHAGAQSSASPHRNPDLLGRDAPTQAALALIPALAIDSAGTRLGQGGGSYDRALARLTPGTPTVAVLHPGELSTTPLPREPHDIPVDGVLTSAGITWIRP